MRSRRVRTGAPVRKSTMPPGVFNIVLGLGQTTGRMLAEHLVSDRGDEVEVFTTAATDALTWRDELAAGTEIIGPSRNQNRNQSQSQTHSIRSHSRKTHYDRGSRCGNRCARCFRANLTRATIRCASR